MREKSYWESRMENLILTSERSVLEYEQMLEEAYERALVAIRTEIEAFYQRYAKENKIPYSEVRRRLNAIERADFNTLLKKWYEIASEGGLPKEYSEYLKDLGKRVYVTRLEYLEASIRFEIERLKTNQHIQMTDLLDINYMSAYHSAYFAVAQGMEVAINFATVDRAGMEKVIKTRWDGRNYSDSVWADKTKLLKSINTILPRSFSQGLNSRVLGDMIAKEMGTSKNRGRTLARTEVNYVCNQATLDCYKSVEVEQYQYLATLDMRTSEICRGLDGFIGKVSQAKVGVNYPPAHPNCRSTTVPYFLDDKSQFRLAKDESGKTIRVPRKMTQEEWINKYAPEDQREKLLRFKRKFSPAE